LKQEVDASHASADEQLVAPDTDTCRKGGNVDYVAGLTCDAPSHVGPQEGGVLENLDVPTVHEVPPSAAEPSITYTRRSSRMSKDVEAEKMEKKQAAVGKKAEIDDQKKQVGQSKKGDKELMKLQVEMDKQLKRNQDALNKDTVQAQEATAKRISKMLATQGRKQYAAKRKKYEEDLDRLRNEANVELAILHSTIPKEAWSSSSASQIQFPTESEDEISNLTPPVRLS